MAYSAVKFIIGVILPYAAFAIFVLGVMWRLWTWARASVPLRLPTTPGPKTIRGVILRMLSEIFIFRSLFRDKKTLWLGALIFHATLLIVLIRHLRFFLYPVPAWMNQFQYVASDASYLLLASLFFLLIRRLTDEKDIYLLALADIFPLALLLSIAGTGTIMSRYARADLLAVKDYVLSLLALRPVSMPDGAMFQLHFVLVMVFLMYFPFSKIMHAPGILFSPSRNQRADYQTRFVNPWDPGEKTT